jgi:putative endonuclease
MEASMTQPATTPPVPNQRQALGAYGETVAARYLVAAGMVLLDHNWRCELGEVDLVLRDGHTLVVCEVKTRSSTRFGSPLEAVTERKAARLRRLAARWLAEHQIRPDDVRIDLVGVLVNGHGEPEFDHVRGVG